MAKAVMRDAKGQWWGYVWDGEAEHGGTCPDTAMLYERCAGREEAERWCRLNETNAVTRYRARCAWEERLPVANQSWLDYYRQWNADMAVLAAHLGDPDEEARLWQEVYEQGG